MGEGVEKNRSRRRNLWIFFGLTFGLSWVLWIAAAVSGQDVTATAWGIPFILGGFGPSVAGIYMIRRTRGKKARRDFWRRVVDVRRISFGWYLVIFPIFPGVFAATLLVNGLLGGGQPELNTLSQVAANPTMLLGMIIIGLMGGPLSEELGWRGFALEALQERWSPLVSSAILAPIWWIWHLPLFFVETTTHYSWGLGTPSFWLFAAQILPLSVLFTWGYNRNGRSILAAVLLHFTCNFTLSLVYPYSVQVFAVQVILLFVAVGALVLFGTRAQRGVTAAAPRVG
jgi:membrane protease YdiL (CAAX protease family)